jgi:hypothetical protein
MSAFASSLIDWGAVWKIALVALLAGGGVVITFGFGLLSLEHARSARNGTRRYAHMAVATLCGVCCVGAVGVGIYAMTLKPSPKPAPKSRAAT